MKHARRSPRLAGGSLPRRTFLHTVPALLGAPLALPLRGQPPAKPAWRAAVIGATGRGNYGHMLDVAFNHRDDVQVVAVADPNQKGRESARRRSRAARAYGDYREMLEKERPDLVSIAPRWSEHHHAMGMAAMKSGAHILMEKPVTPTLAEGDELLRTAKQLGRRFAVAHQMRISEGSLKLKQALSDGVIGELREIHAVGKQDRRVGGEDLLVLGVHLFDLMLLHAGEPLWCTARVMQDGRDITREDIRPANENIGPVAGNDMTAQFAFPNGVHATFTSRPDFREAAGPYGMTLIGTRGRIWLQASVPPRIFIRRGNIWTTGEAPPGWETFSIEKPSMGKGSERNARIVDDWISAIEEDREPFCSGDSSLKALEMIMAIYEAALSGRRARLPLKNRFHPLDPEGRFRHPR